MDGRKKHSEPLRLQMGFLCKCNPFAFTTTTATATGTEAETRDLELGRSLQMENVSSFLFLLFFLLRCNAKTMKKKFYANCMPRRI